MKLSAVLIHEKLLGVTTSYSYGKNANELCLSRPEFFKEGRRLERGHLYITLAQYLNPVPQGDDDGCLICIGSPPGAYLKQRFSVICISETLDIFDLFDRLNNIFELFDNWERLLLQCVNERTPIQRFVDISETIFGNPVYILDSSLRQLVKSKRSVFFASIAEDMEKLVRVYAETPVPSDDDGAIALWNDQLQLRIITKALRSHDRFAISITLIETERPFVESDTALIDYMSYYILSAFEFGHTSTSNQESPVSLATIFTQLLRGEQVTAQKIQDAGNVFGWKPGHLYRVYFIKPSDPVYSFASRIHQSRQMERQFTSSIALALPDDNYALIENISLGENHTEIILRFTSVLQNLNFTCGVSTEFHELTRLAEYHSLAKYALENGNKIDFGKTIHSFSDYRLHYMLSHCCGGIENESFFPDGLRRVLEHDRRYKTPYLLTLITYCDCKYNATHAAKSLHVHRTTFLDRFTKIQDILHIDFNNPSDRLHLLISLEHLRKSVADFSDK